MQEWRLWSTGGNKAEWRMIPLCLFWCLWLERNGRYLQDICTFLSIISQWHHFYRLHIS
ncbi:hypothetical protein I3842_07G188300 [Carya illinoinensis]|uniref:Uncharacterized protein n=1 Tax=Carya illinoinensis TaxID=32201 RepID=A0A922JFD1_CARIL|nr:hypothetical protein I3842_07G188300 [Carya illinoinensis]